MATITIIRTTAIITGSFFYIIRNLLTVLIITDYLNIVITYFYINRQKLTSPPSAAAVRGTALCAYDGIRGFIIISLVIQIGNNYTVR